MQDQSVATTSSTNKASPCASKAIIALENGMVFPGVSLGATGLFTGELVFHTSATGYQEILTDPSYAGQAIVFTTPHIGNVGVNYEDCESEAVHCIGLVTRSFSEYHSNWRSKSSLKEYLIEQERFIISEVDTRSLTRVLRKKGSMNFCVMTHNVNPSFAVDYAKNPHRRTNVRFEEVQSPFTYVQPSTANSKYRVVVLDCGVKRSILQMLQQIGCKVTVIPEQSASAEQIFALSPDAVVFSNGPGDPVAYHSAIKIAQDLRRAGVPLLGVCLGHQILAIAAGAQTIKMSFGHHGANHPVLDLNSNKISISSQNHCYVVSDENLPLSLKVTHRSLFDHSIAGLMGVDYPMMSFQGHPEASPGPADLYHFFQSFIQMIKTVYAQAN